MNKMKKHLDAINYFNTNEFKLKLYDALEKVASIIEVKENYPYPMVRDLVSEKVNIENGELFTFNNIRYNFAWIPLSESFCGKFHGGYVIYYLNNNKTVVIVEYLTFNDSSIASIYNDRGVKTGLDMSPEWLIQLN